MLPHADHQGHSANEAKRFSREAGGAKAGGNDGERLHAGPGVACGAANCTPLKVHRRSAKAKQIRDFEAEALTPSSSEAAGVCDSAREGQPHHETALGRRGVDNVFDPHEAQTHDRANVLYESRQPLHTC